MIRAFLSKVRGMILYLFGKRSELSRLGRNDVLMAKVVLDIHRKRTRSEFVFAPLHGIHPIHPIERGEALESKNRRVHVVEATRHEIPDDGRISRDYLQRHIPSVSGIKVVQVREGMFVSYEGNGRLGALQQVFQGREGMTVEVELYHFEPEDRPAILRRINRVRRWNGLGALRT